MASDAVMGPVPANVPQGSQAPKPAAVPTASGNSLPPGGKDSAPRGHGGISLSDAPILASAQVQGGASNLPTKTSQAELPALVGKLNKYLNDSGRPTQFRVDPASSGKTIQEINPATGEVVGEFSAIEFPELAKSLGVSGVLVNSRA